MTNCLGPNVGTSCSKSVVKGMPNRCGGWILAKLELSIHVVQVCMCIQRSPAKIQTPAHMNVKPYRPQHDRLATYVIAQQYSSATFVSFPQGKIWRAFPECYSTLFFLLQYSSVWNCVTWNCVNRGMYVGNERDWGGVMFLPPSEWNSVRPVS